MLHYFFKVLKFRQLIMKLINLIYLFLNLMNPFQFKMLNNLILILYIFKYY